jgi:hypothetical protein
LPVVWRPGRDSLALANSKTGQLKAVADHAEHAGATGLAPPHWERATPAQRAYLEAMAQDCDGPSQSREVSARLGKTPTGVGPIRDSLIRKGLIYTPEHGQVAYTVPGMAEFTARQSRP